MVFYALEEGRGGEKESHPSISRRGGEKGGTPFWSAKVKNYQRNFSEFIGKQRRRGGGVLLHLHVTRGREEKGKKENR